MAFNADEYISVIVEQIAGNFKTLHETVNACKLLKEKQKNLNDSFENSDYAKLEIEVQDLEKECTKYKSIEPLTVGLFGEWGSGKTHLLKLIEKQVIDLQKEKSEIFPQTTIPIFFNAWRFEKEEHLIVPLFQTLLAAIETFESNNVNKSIKQQVGRTKERLKILSFALAKGFNVPKNIKTTVASLMGGDFTALVDFMDVEKVSKEFEKGNEASFVTEKSLTELLKSDRIESIYMNIPQWIEKITIADKINFVFLIDDLDRCLPENTLKMLESIKLFLDVPSCAFVLAIDDDVVERGVEHHYRDYLKDMVRHELPITGHEYLEKMIQLPFRIPVIDVSNVREFLVSNYAKSIFSRLDDEKEIYKKSDEVILFFSKNIPAKPRKIKRTAMLFDTKLKIYDKLKEQNKLTLPLNHMLLAKITLLELFAPKLLRFIQNNGYQRIYNRLGHFRGVDDERKEELISLSDSEVINSHIKKDYTPKEQLLFKRLMNTINEGTSSRMVFDLDSIFDKLEKPEDLKVNIELKESAKKEEVKPTEEVTSLSTTFWEKLFRENDETSWRDAFDDNELFVEGKALLSISQIEEISKRAKDKKGFSDNPKWLLIIAEYITQMQFVKMLKEIYPYEMNKYQTTFEEYDDYCEEIGIEKPIEGRDWGRGKRPVINVSWEDATAYANWLSKKEDKKYRLPTEDEWFLACSVGAKTVWHFGDDGAKLKEYAWYDENSDRKIHPVGVKKPNVLGLYDMHGNVWEWCEDWYDKEEGFKVLRGSCYLNSAVNTGSVIQDWVHLTKRSYGRGFRLLRILP